MTVDMDERTEIMQRIIDRSGSLFHHLNPRRDQAWQSVDLTMPQLKALICVAQSEAATSGQIARRLGVGLSTVTGIVDRLAEHELVTRHEDREDRRVTRVLPTERGRALVDELLRYRNEVITAVLSRLDTQQLRCVETAVGHLTSAVLELACEREGQELVV